MVYEWRMIPMPTAPLIRFAAALFDNLYDPFRLEHFLNIGDPDQARCLSRLTQQSTLSFDFYDFDYEFTFSRPFAHPALMRARLESVVQQAVNYYDTIPPDQRDFDQAKELFQRYFPL
jgi:hypothetical protein